MQTKKPLREGKKGNAWGQYRKTPEPRGFEFIEKDGVKVLKQHSNDTSTSVRHDGLALELEIRQAMTYSNEMYRKNRQVPSCEVLRSKFPVLDRYCNNKEVCDISNSDGEKKSPHKEAVAIMVNRLQIPRATIERYFRQPSTKKRSSSR